MTGSDARTHSPGLLQIVFMEAFMEVEWIHL